MKTSPAAPEAAGARPYRRRFPWRRLSNRSTPLAFSIVLVVVVLASGGCHLGVLGQPPQATSTRTPTATLTPTAIPTPTADELLARQVAAMISQMSLQEELGQLIMVAFNGTTFTADLRTMVTHQYVGGMILYASNITGYTQVQTLDKNTQAQAQIPLFIATDQEGGIVNRLESIIGPVPSAQQIGNTNDPQQAFNRGVQDGQMLAQVGINVDLAPVVDVHSTTKTIIPTRMFGTTPEKVALFAGEYLDGLQDQGIIGCLKHWPGLGSSPVDPHDVLPVINRTQQELNDIDFAPYRTLIGQGHVQMIMSTHELITAYDDQLPASISPIMINQVLRQDLGYSGVVITDGLYMGALDHWGMVRAAVMAVEAGNDIILGPRSSSGVQQVLNALQAALTSGELTKARIDLSVARILALKIRAGTIPAAGK